MNLVQPGTASDKETSDYFADGKSVLLTAPGDVEVLTKAIRWCHETASAATL